MKSLSFRYFIMIALLIIMSFMALGVSFLSVTSGALTSQRMDSLERGASEVSSATQIYWTGQSLDIDFDFVRSLTMLANSLDAHIMVCGKDGSILACSDPPGLQHTGQNVSGELLQLGLSGPNSAQGVLDNLSPETLDISVHPVTTPQGDVCGIVVFSSSSVIQRALLLAFVRIFLLTAVIVLLLAVFSVFGTSRVMARPLLDMAACAQAFAQGDFSARVFRWAQRGDEVGELASAFNAMADAISKAELLRRDFIANVSHELKTPMTIVTGYIEGLLDGTIDERHTGQTLTLVRNEVLRLSRMVASMTQISVLQSGQFEIKQRTFNLCELSMRILLGMEGHINARGLDVDVLLPDDQQLFVNADPDLMAQVLTNLLDNAVKFSEQGGTLTLSMSKRGGKVLVNLINTGPTIPPEDLPYIFERFHKTDRSRSQDRTGLGLGLFLVKSILGAHHEDIHVTSENGVTEFSFSLPEAKARIQ